MRRQHQTIELSASKVEGDFDHLAVPRHAAKSGDSAERKAVRHPRFFVLRRLFGLLFMALLAVRAIGAADHVSLAAHSPIVGSDYHGFKADWVDDIIDVLEDIINGGDEGEEEPVKTAQSAINDGLVNLDLVVQQTGTIAPGIRPWAGAVLNYVESDIDAAQLAILDVRVLSSILNQQSQPATTFVSLEDCASQCLAWGEEARNELNRPLPDFMLVYNRLEAIRLALPQYRALAGVQ